MDKRIYTNSDLCTGCGLCEAACTVTRFGENNPQKSGIVIKRDLFERFEIQFLCKFCDEPRCVSACISQAMRKEEDGLVRNDPQRCVGCFSCVMVCPYGSIRQVDWEGKEHKVALKCDLCSGRRDVPACVFVCPTEALVYK